MLAAADRHPLQLVAVVARRGEDDLRDLAALIRGAELDPERVDALRRAGLLRAGSPPRVPAKLVAPVLALESALGLRGDGPLAQLLALLKGAAHQSERDTLLAAMADQLTEHLDELGEGRPLPGRGDLRDLLDDLKATISRLDTDQADPAFVTRVSELCARLIERLAGTLTIRRARRTAARPLPALDARDLASAVFDQVHVVCVPLRTPSTEALARALLGTDALPQASTRRETLGHSSGQERRRVVAEALTAPDPAVALYGGQDPKEALRRHATLLSAGSDGLAAAGWRSTGTLRDGPAPLAWSTGLAETAAYEEAAA